MNKIIETNKVEKPFPKLMEYIHHEAYVYFKEPGVGVVVFGEKFFLKFYNVDAWEMSSFIDTDVAIQVNTKE